MKFTSVFKTLLLSSIYLVVPNALADGHESDSQEMSRGEYLARAGNCVACHTIEDGKPYAGGLKMAVPMLGAIYTTNITPDPETGIGNYTYEDFDVAMRLGVAKQGYNLYPAMPYPSYAKINEEDMRALYDYFMNEVEPVNQPNLENEIPWPLNMRWPLAVWNMLFLDDETYVAKPDQSDAWNQGAYLVQGLGHCGACHTPRGLMFQEAGMDETSADFLSGAVLDHWSASSLNGDINSGLGRWTEDEVFEYLKTGKNMHTTAFGTMVEVINNSTQYMTDEDLRGMAVYLKSLPAVREKDAIPYEYDDTTAQQLANYDFSARGADTYYEYCVWCHMADGGGMNKYQPSLAGNPAVLDPASDSIINLILNGSLRVVIGGEPENYDMPHYRVLLNDQEVADVSTFIRNSWGNKASAVTPQQVSTIRYATDPTHHDIVVLRMK